MFKENKQTEDHSKANSSPNLNRGESSPELLFRFVSAIKEEIVSQVTAQFCERLKLLDSQLNENSTHCRQIRYSQHRLEKQLEALIRQNALLEEASKENHLLGGQHYREHITDPMARSLFPVFDVIVNTRQGNHNSDSAHERDLDNTVEQIYAQLKQFLSIYQIQPFMHKPGAKFDPKLMKPLRSVPTNEEELNGRVAQCLQIGFRQGEQTILRPEAVALYQYKPSAITLSQKMKGDNYVCID